MHRLHGRNAARLLTMTTACLAFVLPPFSSATAADFTWTAQQAGEWSAPENWAFDGQDDDGIPDADDVVVFNDRGAGDATLTTPAAVLSVEITGAYEGTVQMGAHPLSVAEALTVEPALGLHTGTAAVVITGNARVDCTSSFYDLILDAGRGGVVTVVEQVTVLRDLHVRSVATLAGGHLLVHGQLVVEADPFAFDNGMISLVGEDDQTLSGDGVLPELDIAKAAGTVDFGPFTTFTTLSIGDVGWDPNGAALTANQFNVREGGNLSGIATFNGPMRIQAAGTLTPPPGGELLINGDLSFDEESMLFFEAFFDGEIVLPGELQVIGAVDLSGAALVGIIGAPFEPDTVFIHNDGVDPIAGNLLGVPEGGTTIIDDAVVTVTYTGGDGNDLTLSVSEEVDTDADGVPDPVDNCIETPNEDQADIDDDGLGDVCDPCPEDLENLCELQDRDDDGVIDEQDNCPDVPNADQADLDEDGLGDDCDDDMDGDGIENEAERELGTDPADPDSDDDGVNDGADAAPDDAAACADTDEDGCDDCSQGVVDPMNDGSDLDGDGLCDLGDDDDDNDGVSDAEDNCPEEPNEDQGDSDGDGVGDACDGFEDTDDDGIADEDDNCLDRPNADQADADGDGVGDACEPDSDEDGVADDNDNCPDTANADQADMDGDGVGDVCESDTDDDGVPDDEDNCPAVPNADQADEDGDGIGDACEIEADTDEDGVPDRDDNCPDVANADQADADADGVGDACEDPEVLDGDEDGVDDASDNCAEVANPDQIDVDGDSIGDACDPEVVITGTLDGSVLFGCQMASAERTGSGWIAALALLAFFVCLRRGLMGRSAARGCRGGAFGVRETSQRAGTARRVRGSARRNPVLSGLIAAALLSGCATAPPAGPGACVDTDSLEVRALLEPTQTLRPDRPVLTVRAGASEEDDGEVFGVEIPPGMGSVTLVASRPAPDAVPAEPPPDGAPPTKAPRTTGDHLIVASVVQSPTGAIAWDFHGDRGALRTHPDHAPYTLALPTTRALALTEGVWRVRLTTARPSGEALTVQAIYTPERTRGTLDLNIFLVGVDGLDAASAGDDARFQRVLGSVRDLYGRAGVDFGEIAYIDIKGDEAKRFRVTSTSTGEVAELLALSEGHNEQALNLFFVAELEGDGAGYTLLGQSGGVPGPPLAATGKSGVVVSLAPLEFEPSTIEVVMAHEMGHFLGLYHTTERNGERLNGAGIQGLDPLCDTPACPDALDRNGNRLLSAAECGRRDGGNLMFGLAEPSSRTLTPEQAHVLRNHPLVR